MYRTRSQIGGADSAVTAPEPILINARLDRPTTPRHAVPRSTLFTPRRFRGVLGFRRRTDGKRSVRAFGARRVVQVLARRPAVRRACLINDRGHCVLSHNIRWPLSLINELAGQAKKAG